jgi:hypothetical protein
VAKLLLMKLQEELLCARAGSGTYVGTQVPCVFLFLQTGKVSKLSLHHADRALRGKGHSPRVSLQGRRHQYL